MSKSYPDAIPAAYAKHADLTRAYRMGWNHGHGIACHNVPRIGDSISRCVDYVGLGKRVTEENIREYHELCCFAAESNSRDYSPFEFTAHEFNSAQCEQPNVIQTEDGFAVVSALDESDVLEEFDTRQEAQAYADSLPLSEELWEAYETGTGDSIRADLSEYTDEDYGIEPESEELEDESED